MSASDYIDWERVRALPRAEQLDVLAEIATEAPILAARERTRIVGAEVEEQIAIRKAGAQRRAAENLNMKPARLGQLYTDYRKQAMNIRIKLITNTGLEKWIGRSDTPYNPIRELEEWHQIKAHIIPGRPRSTGEPWEWETTIDVAENIVTGLRQRRAEYAKAFNADTKRTRDAYDGVEIQLAIDDLRQQITEARQAADH